MINKNKPGYRGSNNPRIPENQISPQQPLQFQIKQKQAPYQQQQQQQTEPSGPSGQGPQPKPAPVMGTAHLGLNRGVAGGNNSRRSLGRRDSLVATPPLPPLSPEASPTHSPAVSPARNPNQYQRSYR